MRAFRLMHTVAAAGRPRDRAEAPEPDLLPDQRRGARGGAGGGRDGAAPGHDWFYPYYRDRALVPHAGRHAARDAAAGRGRGGRPGVRRAPDALALGASRAATSSARRRPRARSFCRRWGAPKASRYQDAAERTRSRWSAPGEGATSEGEFWEALNAAAWSGCRCCSWSRTTGTPSRVPVEAQTAGRQHLARWRRVSRGCSGRTVDGTDFLACLPRDEGRGGVLPRRAAGRRWCTRTCIRPYSHSLSDDERLYKTAAERAGRGGARSGAAVSRSS